MRGSIGPEMRKSSLPQRGFITLPIAGYLLAGSAAVIAVLCVATWALGNRLDSERAAHAVTKANLALWERAARDCSNATKKAAEEAEKRTRNAAAALEAARKGVVATQNEIARLKAAKPSGSACPSGEAVAKVREGLR